MFQRDYLGILLLAFVWLSSCSAKKEGLSQAQDKDRSAKKEALLQDQDKDPVKYGLSVLCEHPASEVDWSKIDPITFIKTLEECDRPFVTIMNCPPEGWLKADQSEWLMKLQQSDEPCASFVDVQSSILPRGKTTVGRAVTALLEQFGKGKSPGFLRSPKEPGNSISH